MLPQCWVRLLRLDNAEICKAGLAIDKKEPIDPLPEDFKSPKAACFGNIKSELLPRDKGDSSSIAPSFIQNDNTRGLVKVEPVREEEKTGTSSTKLKKNPSEQQELNFSPLQGPGYVIDHWWFKRTVDKLTPAIPTNKKARRSLRLNKKECFVIHQCKMCLKTYESESPCLLKHLQTHLCWVKLERCNDLAEEPREDSALSIEYVANDDKVGSPRQDPLSDFSQAGVKKIKIENNGDPDTKENNDCSAKENIALIGNSCEPSVYHKFETDGTYSQQDVASVDTKPNICENCRQIFLNKQDLSLHQKLHEEVVKRSPSVEMISKLESLVKLEILPEFSCYFCNKIFHLKSLLEIHILLHMQPSKSTSETEYLQSHRGQHHFPELDDDLMSVAAEDKTSHLQKTPIKEILSFDLFKPCTSASEILLTESNTFAINEESSLELYQNNDLHSSNLHLENQKKLEPYLPTTNPNSVLENPESSMIVCNNVIQNHGKRSVYCNECGKSFHKKRSLRHHLVSHTWTKKTRCDTCRKTYKAYQNHVRRDFHVNKGGKCTVCDKKFRRYLQSCERRKICPEVKWHACKDCGKRLYPTKPQSAQIFSKDYHFLCHICGIHCKFGVNLIKHLRIKHADTGAELETDGILHKCPSCPAAFTRISDLRAHKCAHLVGQTSANHTKNGCVCKTCGKILGNDHAYSLHVRSHGYRNHMCFQCDVRLTSKKKLVTHNAQFHNPKHSFKCYSCPMTYETEKGLETHEAAAHSSVELLRCDVCLEWFTSTVLLSKHEESHDDVTKFCCRFCKKIFVGNAKYLTHLTQAHDKWSSYKCRFCPLAFMDLPELKSHMKEHKPTKATDIPKIVITQRLCDREGTLDYQLNWLNIFADQAAG